MWDYAEAVATDSSGDIYVVGRTRSEDFPTADPYQGEKKAQSTNFDRFLSKISADGQDLVYSTYLGGEGDKVQSWGSAVAVDGEGRAIVAGYTESPHFPTRNALAGGESLRGAKSAFVTRFSPDGKSLDFSTYLGGGGAEEAWAAAVDEEGNIYIAGWTNSTDFPVESAYQPSRAGTGENPDVFVTKFTFDEATETLSIAYSTYLGGSAEEELHGLALGGDGSAYLVGQTASGNFPTENPFQESRRGGASAFVSRLSPDGSSLLYSTFLGGGGRDSGRAIAVDDGGDIYVGGWTVSADFPTRNALFPSRKGTGGHEDGFVARLSGEDGDLVFSTYLAGNWSEDIRGIGLGDRGIFVAGETRSSDFPLAHPHQAEKPSSEGQFRDTFLCLLAHDGSELIFSTYWGGRNHDDAGGLAVDRLGRVVVAGSTRSNNFPLLDAFQDDPGPWRAPSGVWIPVAFISKFEFEPLPSPTTTTTTTSTTTTKTTTTVSTKPSTSTAATTTLATTTTTTTTTTATTTAVLPTPPATPMATATPAFPPTPEPTPDPVNGGIWYLPAGGTKVGELAFDTYILIANPGEEDAGVEIAYVGEDEEIGWAPQTVAAGTRFTANMRASPSVGPGRENVGTIVRSTNNVPVIVERAMYFPGGGDNSGWTGSHNTIGLNRAGTEWFLAEGATHIFDQYVHILNPGTLPAEVTVTFFNQTGKVASEAMNLPGRRVWTVKAGDVKGAGGRSQLSTRVESTVPVAVDRTMYWPKGGKWKDGHATIGVTEFAEEWYLPEGATHIFDQFVLVANPNENTAASVSFTFTDQGEGVWNQETEIPPLSRYTVKANNIVGVADQVSTRITSNIPVVAERAMYWPQGDAPGWTGGHGTVGVSKPKTVWQLPEGATHIFDMYVLVANPSKEETANVTFIFRGGEGIIDQPLNRSVEPGRRFTVKANDVVGQQKQVATTVESDIPVVVERAMYLPGQPRWKTGHVTVGWGE